MLFDSYNARRTIMSVPTPKLKTNVRGSKLTIHLDDRTILTVEDSFTTLLELQDHLTGMFPSEQRQWVKDYIAEKLSP